MIKYNSGWRETTERIVDVLKAKKYYNQINPAVILNTGENWKEENPNIIVLNKNVEDQKDKIRMNMLLDRFLIPHPKTIFFPFRKHKIFIIENYRLKKLFQSTADCVVKKRYSCSGSGVRFTKFNQVKIDNLTVNHYIQQFIPFEREFRVVVDWFGCIGIKEKVGNSKCRNLKSSKFVKVEEEMLDLREFAVQCCRKLRIDFSGMDIGLYKGQYYVIELNSCPGLMKEQATTIANHMIGILHK